MVVVGAGVHPPSQDPAERRDVGRGGRGVRGGPAALRRRTGEVAQAVAALGHRADLSEVGAREGGAGTGALHWR